MRPIDHRDDGGHDAATFPVLAQDPERVAEEAVDVAAQRRAERADDSLSELVAVFEQVVHDQGAEDDAADQADDAADAFDELGDEAVGDHRGGSFGGRPGILQRCGSTPATSS